MSFGIVTIPYIVCQIKRSKSLLALSLLTNKIWTRQEAISCLARQNSLHLSQNMAAPLPMGIGYLDFPSSQHPHGLHHAAAIAATAADLFHVPF